MSNFRFLIAAVCLLGGHTLRAEIATDGTLGGSATQTLAGPDYLIGAELGEQHGANLFHSFSVFNLSTQESATFSGPSDIAHIIGRITGGSPSAIAGTLRSRIPGSQLWLFNPNGLEFSGVDEVPGRTATAQALALGLKDGGIFRADTPGNSVLTVAPPQVFFLAPQPEPAPVLPAEEAAFYQSSVEKAELVLPFTVGREQGSRILEEPGVCGKTRGTEISRLRISHYLGAPLSPDDWQGSGLPPLDEPPAQQDRRPVL